jgi:hypothetical protein
VTDSDVKSQRVILRFPSSATRCRWCQQVSDRVHQLGRDRPLVSQTELSARPDGYDNSVATVLAEPGASPVRYVVRDDQVDPFGHELVPPEFGKLRTGGCFGGETNEDLAKAATSAQLGEDVESRNELDGERRGGLLQFSLRYDCRPVVRHRSSHHDHVSLNGRFEHGVRHFCRRFDIDDIDVRRSGQVTRGHQRHLCSPRPQLCSNRITLLA